MFNTEENDICINCGCYVECKDCSTMHNPKCLDFESKNTRRSELSVLYKSII